MKNGTIGNRTRDLPAFGAVPQPTPENGSSLAPRACSYIQRRTVPNSGECSWSAQCGYSPLSFSTTVERNHTNPESL